MKIQQRQPSSNLSSERSPGPQAGAMCQIKKSYQFGMNHRQPFQQVYYLEYFYQHQGQTIRLSRNLSTCSEGATSTSPFYLLQADIFFLNTVHLLRMSHGQPLYSEICSERLFSNYSACATITLWRKLSVFSAVNQRHHIKKTICLLRMSHVVNNSKKTFYTKKWCT